MKGLESGLGCSSLRNLTFFFTIVEVFLFKKNILEQIKSNLSTSIFNFQSLRMGLLYLLSLKEISFF